MLADTPYDVVVLDVGCPIRTGSRPVAGFEAPVTGRRSSCSPHARRSMTGFAG